MVVGMRREAARKPRDPRPREGGKMFTVSQPIPVQTAPVTPLSLSDHLITLAKKAEIAGYSVTAEKLVRLALTIFDEAPRRPH